jgi:hypothetical protein
VTDDLTPKWAVELLVRFEQLDAKITTAEERNNSHASWAERNIKDLEMRMRAQEQANDPRMNERVRNLETFRYLLTGLALASGLLGAGVQKMIGG